MENENEILKKKEVTTDIYTANNNRKKYTHKAVIIILILAILLFIAAFVFMAFDGKSDKKDNDNNKPVATNTPALTSRINDSDVITIPTIVPTVADGKEGIVRLGEKTVKLVGKDGKLCIYDYTISATECRVYEDSSVDGPYVIAGKYILELTHYLNDYGVNMAIDADGNVLNIINKTGRDINSSDDEISLSEMKIENGILVSYFTKDNTKIKFVLDNNNLTVMLAI